MRKQALHWMSATGLVALAAISAIYEGGQVQAAVAPNPVTAGPLSIMSYNIEGLPPPVRFGRAGSIARIGAGLAEMRRENCQPRVVLLQEAFRDAADRVAAVGGYRYVAHGPSADAVNDARPLSRQGRSLAAGAARLSGENDGKWLGSGLAILSDYPIERVERMAFPQWACAGFDCLANKGAMIAWIAVPGTSQPVAFVDTHLNSRGASGTDPLRADRAYGIQLASLRAMLRNRIPESQPAFLAGDFNVGAASRRIKLTHGGVLADATSADVEAARDGSLVPSQAKSDFAALLKRNKDFLFYRGSADWRLRMTGLTIPFGRAPDGSALSDHLGYKVSFSATCQENRSSRRS